MNQSRSKIVIVLTGGHGATTALSVVEELKRRSKKKTTWDIYWIGTSRAFEGKKIPSIESKILPKFGVKFKKIITGRVQRKFTFWTIPSLLKIPIGFLHAFFMLLKIKPKVILSFGGFASFPVVVSGWILRIPIVIHEQTSQAGRANRLSSIFANQIAVARKSSLKYFPSNKTKVCGNPIIKEIEGILPKKSLVTVPTIYITGGSRGSVSLNLPVFDVANQLLKCYKVIHQTGQIDYDKFIKLKKSLPKQRASRYRVEAEIDPDKIPQLLSKADLVIARAGANTVAEIIAAKRPSILVPLPISYLNEQLGNAQYAQQFGTAQILDQKTLTGKKLLDKIENVFRNWTNINEGAKGKENPDIKASSRLVDIIEKVIIK